MVVAAEGNNRDAGSVARIHRRIPCGGGNWPDTPATPPPVGQVPELAATTRAGTVLDAVVQAEEGSR
ncbi:MAG: hypothetical protein ACLQUY_13045 [Ktedonobacterales bacterium]